MGMGGRAVSGRSFGIGLLTTSLDGPPLEDRQFSCHAPRHHADRCENADQFLGGLGMGHMARYGLSILVHGFHLQFFAPTEKARENLLTARRKGDGGLTTGI